MTIYKMINELIVLIQSHGDLEVGYIDNDFGYFVAIKEINFRKTTRQCDDDKSLGESFIGIE